MPARNRSQKPPAAPRSKRMLHALYMAQPLLQFVALMAVLLVLGRCSPLSPSTEKSALKKTSDNGVVATPAGPSEQANNQAQEEDIKKSLRDVNDAEDVAVVSEKEFNASSRESIHGNQPADSDRVKFVFQSRKPRLLVLPLSAEEKQNFAQGAVRIDLAKRLSSQMSEDTRKLYFNLLYRQLKRLHGRAVVLLSQDQMDLPEAVNSLPIRARVQLGFLGDDQAFLRLSRAEEHIDDAQQELIRSHMERAVALAVVLE